MKRPRRLSPICSSLDECKEWADKAAALASYGKQMDDDTLFKFGTTNSAAGDATGW